MTFLPYYMQLADYQYMPQTLVVTALPPSIESSTFYNYNATLHVLPGCKSVYESADNWKYFTNIVEDAENPDAITAPIITSNNPFYDLTGRKVSKAQKGVYIQNGKKMINK